MDKIRIARNVKHIEVNDNGECIVLDFDDRILPRKYLAIMKDMSQKKTALDEKLKNCSDTESLEIEYEINVYFKDKIDEIFGEGTCRKVYGDILPSIEMHMDFLEQILPFFEEYAATRRNKMSKYNAKRLGNV